MTRVCEACMLYRGSLGACSPQNLWDFRPSEIDSEAISIYFRGVLPLYRIARPIQHARSTIKTRCCAIFLHACTVCMSDCRLSNLLENSCKDERLQSTCSYHACGARNIFGRVFSKEALS